MDKKLMIQHYSANKSVSKGKIITCPCGCNVTFLKAGYQHSFHINKGAGNCKDRYFNATRIKKVKYPNLTRVTGAASYSILVNCPKCDHQYDLTDDDHDDEYIATKAMFTNTSESCTNIGFHCTCPECETEFVLDTIDY